MNINNNYTPNFKAKYISTVEVEKIGTFTKKYKDTPVSFVEINHKNKKDIKAIDNVAKKWKTAIFADNIRDTVHNIADGYLSNKYAKVYALTEQTKNFENLKSKDILCLADINDCDNFLTINFLQVKPEYISGTKSQKFKHVGSGTIDAIKKKYKNHLISLYSTEKAIPFYENQNFEHESIGSKYLYWKSDFDGVNV